MITPAEVALMRADHTAMLTDTCLIRTPPVWVGPVGSGTLQPGAVAEVIPGHGTAPVRCRVVDDANVAGRSAVAGQDATVRRFTVTLPWEVTVPVTGMDLEIVQSDSPKLVGLTLRLVAEQMRTVTTGLRVAATLNLAPGEG